MMAFRIVLEIQALLGVSYGVSRLVRSAGAARLLFILAFAAPLVASTLPSRALLERPARFASHEKLAIVASEPAPAAQSQNIRPVTPERPARDPLMLGFVLALGACTAFGCARLAWQLWRLRRGLSKMYLARQIGRVSVLISDEEPVPYAGWLPAHAFIVMPSTLLGMPGEFRIALAHELQHLRARDPQWALVLELARALFFANPFIHAWAAWLARLQEFACDEALVGRHRISLQAYGRCLLRVAELALDARRLPVASAGMASGARGSLLKRRIEMLIHGRKKSRAVEIITVAAAMLIVGGISFAAESAIRGRQDRVFTLEQARKLANDAAKSSGVPLDVNDLVLERLNRYGGTRDGRENIRLALARMKPLEPMLERKAAQYNMPRELLYVPVHESGFKNITWSPGAGLWGFIRQTARNYRLVVNEKRDDRLDPEKETDAAMRYLRDLYRMFGDWRLALKAYNEGEDHVMKQIRKFKNRDPWELEHRAQSREKYLASLTAIVILAKNPETLQD